MTTVQQPVDGIAEDVLDQDVPNGGALDGRMPGAAVNVVTVGITTTRPVPPMRATAGRVTLTAAGSPYRIGQHLQRRTMQLACRSADATAYVVIADTEQSARDGFGYELVAGATIPVTTSAELWAQAFTAECTLSWLNQHDQG